MDAAASTLPPAWYADPEVLDAELRLVFRRSWQYVGHTGDLAAAGGWFPGRLAGAPILVTRDAGGRVRALVAVCRHQGAAINPPAGAGATVRCAYHGWAYRLDGSLATAPGFDRKPGFDPTRRALPELPLGTWGPLVFVAGDAQVPALPAALGDAAAAGADVDALAFDRRSRSRLDVNWKQAVEDALAGGAGLLFPATTFAVMPGRIDVGSILPAGPTAADRMVDSFHAPGAEPGTSQDIAAAFRRRLRALLQAR